MYRSRFNKSRANVRRWQIGAGVAGVAVVIAGVGLGVASAAETVPTVNCPQVNNLPAVPAQAQAEVKSNLELLNTQIREANNRIASSVGQGGANFIQNAILGPLKDKRFATINRIETAIGRNAAKPNLNAEGLSGCTLNDNGGSSAQQPVEVPAAGNGGNGNAGNGNAGNGNAGGGDAALPTVNCPELNNLPAVPAQAQAEVQRNLELLNTQIKEANNRIASSVGQGGANFIQNAILGPLEDKRFATINRIETAIGRNAVKPNLNAEGLAPCSLNENGGSSAEQPTEVPPADAGNGGGADVAVATVNCPALNNLPAIPAQAQAEVQRNLELLNTQIREANNRIASSVGQGGANFIQNAILGPLEDKRFSTINRIETAIGRNAVKPNLNAEGLAPCSLNG
jgi:F0F1-type ATP synthase membrane subunit b/b'